MSLSKLNGRLRSPNPAAMLTARLQAAMRKLATMITSVMAWTILRRRAVDGSSDSTATGFPGRERPVRAQSVPVPWGTGGPSFATTTASTGSLPMSALDKCAEGQTVDDACELCPVRG